MNNTSIFFAGAVVGSLTTLISMCFSFLIRSGEEKEHLNELEELTDKHWNECRQIAHYEEENRRMKEQIEQLIKKYE
jgi:hypothetical protein